MGILDDDMQDRGVSVGLVALFVILSTGIAAIGYDQYRRQEREIKSGKRQELVAIADMKAGQIAQWRYERLAHLRAIFNHLEICPALRSAAEGRLSKAETAALAGWLKAFAREGGFEDVRLLDAKAAAATEAVRTGQVVVKDMHRDPDSQAIHMEIALPLDPRGAVVARVDPRTALYPLIQSWPMPSRTAETLLVRREGDQVVFLNDLRHRQGTALVLRLPVRDGGRLPAARAVLGQEGIIDGVDYRGVPVLAAARAVPDSPWYLVAKIDSEEVLAEVRARAVFLGITAGLLITLAWAGVALIWRHQQARFYKQRYQDELERRALIGHFDYLTRYANDAILLADEGIRIIEANESAEKLYGYRREELVGLDLRELQAPESRDDFTQEWEVAGTGLVLETLHRRKGGSIFPVEVSARVIEVDGRKFHQAIVRDITERKRPRRSCARARTAIEPCSINWATASCCCGWTAACR